jgi:hypothetical protein
MVVHEGQREEREEQRLDGNGQNVLRAPAAPPGALGHECGRDGSAEEANEQEDRRERRGK